MDAGRFDALSKSLARRRSRRSLGAGGLAGLVAAALGVDHADAATSTCSLHIIAKTSAGPHKGTTYTGDLTLKIDEKGAIDSGAFATDDGKSHPLVGQASGRALNLRITLADGKVLALDGTADIDLLLCRGDVSGTFGGPSDTDIGAWRTADKSTGAANASSANGGGSTNSGGGSSSSGGGQTTNGSGVSGGGDAGGGGSTGSGCPAGQQACDGQCVDLQTDLNNCGRCGFWCAPGLVCTAGVCVDPGCGNDPQTGAALALCNGICANTATDANNCGACGTVCASNRNETCSNGVCTCAADGAPCANRGVCCSNLCPPNGVCGCVPPGAPCHYTGECCDQNNSGCVNDVCAYFPRHACAANIECISGNCQNGVCA